MTRENKLALVVGFGLILLVGILISDHFSTARSQEAAELSEVLDPLVETQFENPDLIAIRGAQTPIIDEAFDPPPAHTPERPRDAGRAARPLESIPRDDDQRERETADATIRPVGLVPTPAPAEAERLPYVFHEVRSGESLSTICGRVYGDQSLARGLAEYNELVDPDLVRAGHRLRLPSADDLVNGRPTALAPDRSPPGGTPRPHTDPVATPTPEETYTVRKGDVLTGIATKLLGSASKYTVIFDSNRDQLDSPDDIRPGMTLTIPRSTG